MAPLASESDVHYTVFIRLPFPRGDFTDPPPANWNAAKDRALWEILSRPSKGDDMDWKAIADDFNVTLPFLLQQAAWLYDRQLSQVRAQMRKVGNTHSNSPSPALGSVSGSGALGGQAMKRVGSGGSRNPSRLSALQKEAPAIRMDSSSSTPNRAKVPPARTSSTTTVTQIQGMSEPLSSETPTTPKEHGFSSRRLSARRDRPALAVLQKAPQVEEESPPLSSSDDSESESELEDSVPNRRISGVRRFGKYSMQKPSLRDDEDDDDDDSPAFLPLSRNTPTGGRDTHNRDLNSTLRLETATVDAQRRRPEHIPMSRRSIPQTTSLDSSASSGVAVGSPRTGPQREAGPFSPQRVSGLSRPSHRRPASANQSSEETKSMGSSFSDLDDASVTQSALEEALLSGMQHGGMASRVSTISQVLRSRYL